MFTLYVQNLWMFNLDFGFSIIAYINANKIHPYEEKFEHWIDQALSLLISLRIRSNNCWTIRSFS